MNEASYRPALGISFSLLHGQCVGAFLLGNVVWLDEVTATRALLNMSSMPEEDKMKLQENSKKMAEKGKQGLRERERADLAPARDEGEDGAIGSRGAVQYEGGEQSSAVTTAWAAGNTDAAQVLQRELHQIGPYSEDFTIQDPTKESNRGR